MPFNLNEGGLLYFLFSSDKANGIAGRVDLKFFIPCYIIGVLIVIAVSYLLGSINPSIIVSKLIYHDDVRRHGSGNAGMTNMLRTYGKGAAAITLIFDIMKTVIAISFAGLFFGFNYIAGISTGDGICYIAGLFVVVGHIFPCYYGFKGGKGVLATGAMAFMLCPIGCLIMLVPFFTIIAITRYVSLGSVVAAILLPIIINGYFVIVLHAPPAGFIALSTVIAAILIVWRHFGNLKRIGERTEHKISLGKKKKVQDDEGEDE